MKRPEELERYSRVYASVDLDALRFNMDSMKENISRDTKIIGVIKADGYGHGAVPLAKEMESLPYLFGFATATFEEAMILKKSGCRKPVLILGYTFPYSYDEIIREEIRPCLFRQDMLGELSRRAQESGKRVKVHIKVDTGMSRIGISPDMDGIAFVKEAAGLPGIEIEGIFTHFARADMEDITSAVQQMRLFQVFAAKAEQAAGIRIPVKHCSNSAGIIRMPEANMDVVRAGITVYGLWPSGEVERDVIELRPVMELKSRVVYVKEVEPGTPVSYGGTYITDKKTTIATIPVGYADGYPRSLSNRGYVLIRGKRAPILGRVCMDQMMVDVTSVPGVMEGDIVTLMGKDGDECISAEILGGLSGRFNYELVCDIGKRVPRVYLKNGNVAGTKDYYEDI